MKTVFIALVSAFCLIVAILTLRRENKPEGPVESTGAVVPEDAQLELEDPDPNIRRDKETSAQKNVAAIDLVLRVPTESASALTKLHRIAEAVTNAQTFLSRSSLLRTQEVANVLESAQSLIKKCTAILSSGNAEPVELMGNWFVKSADPQHHFISIRLDREKSRILDVTRKSDSPLGGVEELVLNSQGGLQAFRMKIGEGKKNTIGFYESGGIEYLSVHVSPSERLAVYFNPNGSIERQKIMAASIIDSEEWRK